jgi:prevent-host-death family protein
MRPLIPSDANLPIRRLIGPEDPRGNQSDMELIDIEEAGTRLPELVARAFEGEEIIIALAGKPAIRLVPIYETDRPRQGGQWKGKVRIADDFDDLPEDLASAFGVEPPAPDRCVTSACRRGPRRRE